MKYTPGKEDEVCALFDKIATHYDAGNALNSLGLHFLWNRRLAAALLHHRTIIDLCAGTGAIADLLLKNGAERVTLVDFSSKMLDVAKKHFSERAYGIRASFLCADAQDVPLESASCDGISLAYGIRNVPDRMKCFSQCLRLLKPGGTLGILELSRPQNPLLRRLHSFYLRTVVPSNGFFLTKDKAAYEYLQKTIEHFVEAKDLCKELEFSGFCRVSADPLSFGICQLYLAQKPFSDVQ